jgi:hypothetical protein
VSRVRNADEFLLQFQKVRGDYERFFGPHIALFSTERRARSQLKTRVGVDCGVEGKVRRFARSGVSIHTSVAGRACLKRCAPKRRCFAFLAGVQIEGGSKFSGRLLGRHGYKGRSRGGEN